MESRTVSYLLQAKTSGDEQLKMMGDELGRIKLMLGEFGAQSAGIRTVTEELARSATNARLVRGELEQVRQAGQNATTPLITALNELNTNLSGFVGKQKVVLQTVEKLDSGVTVAARGVGILNSQMQRGAIDSELWGKQTGVLIGVLKGAANETGVFSKEAQLLERSLKSAAAVNFKNQMGAAGQAVKTVNVARLDWQGGASDEKTLATLTQLEKGYRATQAAIQSEMDVLKGKATLDEGEMTRLRQLTQLQEKYGQAIRNIGAVQASINGSIQRGSLADSVLRANQNLAAGAKAAALQTDTLIASQKAGQLTSKELASALNNQVISHKNVLAALRAEMLALREKGALDLQQRERLAQLTVAEREYALQLARTAAAQREAAAAGSMRRGFAGGAGMSGNLSNIGMAASFISPEAGMIGMAASMGPMIAGAATVGIAVAGIVKLTKDGQEEAKKLQQAFLVMSANGVENLGEINTQLNNITKNGSDAEKMFSKAELATALAALARGGVKGADALKTLGVSAKLAAAEHIPLSEATERLYGNLQYLDMTADQASGFGDKLARASHLSMASMDNLSKGLNVVGATAHNMGYSVEETLAIMVRLAQKGMDPATIGATGLRNAMQKVLTPSADGAVIYQRLGVSMRDATGHMRSGRDIMEQLRETFSSTRPVYDQLTGDIITKNDMAAMSFKLFGTRSATAFISATGDLRHLTDEVKNSGGFLNTYSNEVVSGLAGSQQRLDAATKNLSSTFAKTFTPALASIVESATSAVQWFDNIATSMSTAKDSSEKFATLKIKADDTDLIIFLKAVYNIVNKIVQKAGEFQDWTKNLSKSTGLGKVGDALVTAVPGMGDHDQRERLQIPLKQAQAKLDGLVSERQAAEEMLKRAEYSKNAEAITQAKAEIASLKEETKTAQAELLHWKKHYAESGTASSSGTAPAAAAQNGKETAQQFIASMTKNVTGDPKIAAWCADVVSKMLSELGQKVKYSNNAAQLEKNIKAAGGVPIALKDAKQGDAVFWHGIDPSTGRPYGAKSGTHTEMFAGWNNGKAMLVGSNTSAQMTGKNFYDQNQATVYRLPAPGEHPQGPPMPVAANSKPDVAGLQSDLDKRAQALYAAWVQTKASGNADPKILADVDTFKKEHKLLWSKIVEDAKVAAKELKTAGVSDADYAKWIAPAQRMAQLQKSTRVGGDTQRKADNQISAWVKASGGDNSVAKKVLDYEVSALSQANKGTKEYIASTAELNKYRAEAAGIAQRQADASKSGSDTAIAASKREVAEFTKDSKVKTSVLAIVTESLKNQQAAEQQAAKVREAAQAGDVTLAGQELARLTSTRDTKIALVKDSAAKRLSVEKDYAQSVYNAGVALADAQLKQAKANANNPDKTDPGNRVQALQIAENEHTQALRKALDERNARTSSARSENLAEQRKYSDASKQLDIETMTSSAARLKQLDDAKLESVKDNLTKVSSLTKGFAKDEYDRQVAIAAATRDRAIQSAKEAGGPNQGKEIAAAKAAYEASETSARLTREKSIADAKKAALDQQKTVAKTQLDADRALAAGRFDLAKSASERVLSVYALEASQVGAGADEKLAFETGWQQKRLDALNVNSRAAAGLEKKRLEEERNTAVNAEGLTQQAKTDLWNQYTQKIKAVDSSLTTTLEANAQTVAGSVNAAQKTVTDNANKEAEATYAAWKKGVFDQLEAYSEKELIQLYSDAAAKHDLELATKVLAEIDQKTSERQANEFLKTLVGSPEDQAGQITEYLAGVGRLLSPAVQAMLTQQRDQLVGSFKFDDIYGKGYVPGANGFQNQKSGGAASQLLDAQTQGEALASRLTGANAEELRSALDEAAAYMADDSRWGVVGDALKKSIQDGLTGAEERYQTWLDSIKVDTASAVKAGLIPDQNKGLQNSGDASPLLTAQAMTQKIQNAGATRGVNGFFIKPDPAGLKTAISEAQHMLDTGFADKFPGIKTALQTAITQGEDYLKILEGLVSDAVSGGVMDGWNHAKKNVQALPDNAFGQLSGAVFDNADQLKVDPAMVQTFTAGMQQARTESKLTDAQLQMLLALINDITATAPEIKSWGEDAFTSWNDKLTTLTDGLRDGTTSQADFNKEALDAVVSLSKLADAADLHGSTDLAGYYRKAAAGLVTMIKPAGEVSGVLSTLADEAGFNLVGPLITLQQQLDDGAISLEDFQKQALEAIPKLLALAKAADAAGRTDLGDTYREIAKELQGNTAGVSAGFFKLKDDLKSLSEGYKSGSTDLLAYVEGEIQLAQQADKAAAAAQRAGNPELAKNYREQAAAIRSQLGPLGSVVEALGKFRDYAKDAQQVFSLFGQDDWAKSAADVADGIGSTMQAVGGIGKVATGDLSGIKDIIFGALNAVNSFGNAILNLDPKFKLWKKNLLDIAAIEQKSMGTKEVGNFTNPYFDKLQADIDNRTKLANATIWQRMGWSLFGGAPQALNDEAAKSLAKLSVLFNDYAGSLGDIFKNAVGEAFSSGDWGKASANLEKSFDQKIGNLMISKLADLQMKALNLDADIKAWAEAMDKGDYTGAAAINARIKAKISTAFSSPELQAQISAMPGYGADKPVAGSVAEKDSEISDLQDRQKKATSKAEYDDLQSKIDRLTKQRDAITGTSGGNSSITDPAQQRQRDELWNNYNKETDPTKKANFKKQLDQVTSGGSSGTTTITLLPSKDQIDQAAYIKGLMDSAGMQVQAGNIQLDAAKRQQDAASTMTQAAGMILLAAQGQGARPPSNGRTQF